jgi:hypothetical protein
MAAPAPDLVELLTFGRHVAEQGSMVGPEPIAYGSLAYAIHTGDRAAGLNDIDFLAPASFGDLARILSPDPCLTVERTEYHTLKVSFGPLKVSFDALERYLPVARDGATRASLDGFAFLVVGREALVGSYERAAESIPQKRDAYLLKLRRLRDGS